MEKYAYNLKLINQIYQKCFDLINISDFEKNVKNSFQEYHL
jgi:hypothetical protein